MKENCTEEGRKTFNARYLKFMQKGLANFDHLSPNNLDFEIAKEASVDQNKMVLAQVGCIVTAILANKEGDSSKHKLALDALDKIINNYSESIEFPVFTLQMMQNIRDQVFEKLKFQYAIETFDKTIKEYPEFSSLPEFAKQMMLNTRNQLCENSEVCMKRILSEYKGHLDMMFCISVTSSRNPNSSKFKTQNADPHNFPKIEHEGTSFKKESKQYKVISGLLQNTTFPAPKIGINVSEEQLSKVVSEEMSDDFQISYD